ncbi:BTAD domain-containing putative transcriptional regulator [Dactylosporangium salmoneum]|uniref:OmpR/PhoB-type domain-containing protein n=1 Tax=Dactylosporangium salmoneum TaxID=53361 RepID=A0ABP5TPY2_9ACTN
MRFRVLGPLEVRTADGDRLDVGSAKLRTLLTLLLADAGRVVPIYRILDTLWGDAPPTSATGTVQSYVSNLRRLLDPGRAAGGVSSIVNRAPGYLIAADPAEVDLLRLPVLVEEGGRRLDEDEPAQAEGLLSEAVALWRGEPLADLPDDVTVTAERARLAELHLLARERQAVARIRLGRADEAVADLEQLVTAYPLRERLWARLVEALYRSGRQADALDSFRLCARTLRDELGIDPGPELRALEQAVLRQDVALVAVPPHRKPERPAAATPDEPDGRALVGRRGERARLRAALGDVTRGNGAVVVLEGEAGIGKTRLAEAAAALAGAQGWRTVWSRCADDAGVPALWPWSQVLDRLGGGVLTAPVDSDPDQSAFALFQDLRRRLAESAAQAPLLVVLDDVQAADATSLHLLALLGRHLDDMRVLVVATVRTIGEELAPVVVECLTALARAPRAQRLQLGGLGEGDVADLIAARFGDGPDSGAGLPHDTLVKEVHARTDGNPFFVVELVELLRSERQLDVAGVPLPPSVRDVLQRRLARLPEATVELLRLAAVVGRDVDLPLLEASAEMGAEQVITLLEPAVASRVLLEDDVTWQWRFSHALVRETLVAGLSRVQAARLHAVVAGVLENRAGGRPVDVERLAHHSFHAVPVLGTAPARRYTAAAAAAARSRLAHSEAAAHTRRALSLLGAGAAGDRHDLLVALAEDLLRSGRLQEAHDVVAEALAIARQLDDHDRLAEAASVWGGVTLWNWRPYGYVDEGLVGLLETLVGRAGEADPTLLARLLGALGVELAYSDRRGEGVEYAIRAVELSRRIGDPALLGRTLNNYGLVAWGLPDRVTRRMAAADEAIALSGRELPLRTEFFARLHRGPLRLHLGDAAGFAADLAAATRLGARLTGPEVRPHLLYQETGRAMLTGAWDEAEQLAAQAHDHYRATSMWGAQCCRALHEFTFRRRDGRLADVLDLLVDGGDLDVPLLQAVAVLAVAEAGDRDEARRLRRRWPEVTPQDWTTDSFLAVRGWLALALDGDLAAAYRELLPYRGRQIVVGTATSCWGSYDAVLARLAAAQGDPAAAAAHWSDAARAGEQVGSGWQVELARQAGGTGTTAGGGPRPV